MKTEDKMNKELNITFEKDVKSNKWYHDLKYAVIPLLLTVIAIIFSYFFNMWWGKSTGAKPEIWIDKHIPLIPWFVYFYFFTFPMAAFLVFYLACTNKKMMYEIVLVEIIALAISGVVYAVWQTEMVKPAFEAVTFTEKFVVATWNSTKPVNCLPSQHCFMALACFIAMCGKNQERKIPVWFRLFIIFNSVMIILSTVFIKQHYILDFFASLVIIVPLFFIVHAFKFGKKANDFVEKTENIWREKRANKKK